jgi:hypothetical protein
MKEKPGPKPKKLKPVNRLGLEIGRGDKKAIVPPEEVEKLAGIGMKTTEIADWFGVTEQSIRYNFSDEIVKGRLEVKMSLRRAQLKKAIDNLDSTMLIWLGKNMLGQSDNPVSSDSLEPLPWND